MTEEQLNDRQEQQRDKSLTRRKHAVENVLVVLR